MDLALLSVLRDGLLRRSEAHYLTWADVDFRDNGTAFLQLRRSKTDQEGEGVVIYIGKQAAEALKAIRPAEEQFDMQAPVFGLSPQQIGRRVTAAAKAAGLEIWPESGLSQVSGSVFRAVGPAFRTAHGVVRRNLATDSMVKKATARTPMLAAASVLVVISLQKDRVPPLIVVLDSPGLWGSGRDSQRDCPSVPLVCAQHRYSASCASRSV